MINNDVVDSYNNHRLTTNISKIKEYTPAQKDKVKTIGSAAESILNNKDFAQFVHSFKFEKTDELSEIIGYSDEANAQRIAISHQLKGMDDFVASLQKAVYIKNRIVNQQRSDSDEA